jgi:hypothetical protein
VAGGGVAHRRRAVQRLVRSRRPGRRHRRGHGGRAVPRPRGGRRHHRVRQRPALAEPGGLRVLVPSVAAQRHGAQQPGPGKAGTVAALLGALRREERLHRVLRPHPVGAGGSRRRHAGAARRPAGRLGRRPAGALDRPAPRREARRRHRAAQRPGSPARSARRAHRHRPPAAVRVDRAASGAAAGCVRRRGRHQDRRRDRPDARCARHRGRRPARRTGPARLADLALPSRPVPGPAGGADRLRRRLHPGPGSFGGPGGSRAAAGRRRGAPGGTGPGGGARRPDARRAQRPHRHRAGADHPADGGGKRGGSDRGRAGRGPRRGHHSRGRASGRAGTGAGGAAARRGLGAGPQRRGPADPSPPARRLPAPQRRRHCRAGRPLVRRGRSVVRPVAGGAAPGPGRIPAAVGPGGRPGGRRHGRPARVVGRPRPGRRGLPGPHRRLERLALLLARHPHRRPGAGLRPARARRAAPRAQHPRQRHDGRAAPVPPGPRPALGSRPRRPPSGGVPRQSRPVTAAGAAHAGHGARHGRRSAHHPAAEGSEQAADDRRVPAPQRPGRPVVGGRPPRPVRRVGAAGVPGRTARGRGYRRAPSGARSGGVRPAQHRQPRRTPAGLGADRGRTGPAAPRGPGRPTGRLRPAARRQGPATLHVLVGRWRQAAHNPYAIGSALRTSRPGGRGPDPNVVVTEMLPTPEGLWLRDRSGRQYASELRLSLRAVVGQR